MNMYVNQKIQVRWNNLLSSQHNISTGVKQGGCLSPNLFSVYVNHLITNSSNSNVKNLLMIMIFLILMRLKVNGYSLVN